MLTGYREGVIQQVALIVQDYLCEKGGSHFLVWFTPLIIKKCCWRVCGAILGGKTVYISHGGTCMKMSNNEQGLETEKPYHLQCQHEEADTIVLAFHANSISSGAILVRSTDTDVLIILLRLAGRSEEINLILDYGSGNHRRVYWCLRTGCRTWHALTGCDCTSCFLRKGKVRPFQQLDRSKSKTCYSPTIPHHRGCGHFGGYWLYGFKTSDMMKLIKRKIILLTNYYVN